MLRNVRCKDSKFKELQIRYIFSRIQQQICSILVGHRTGSFPHINTSRYASQKKI